MAVAAVADDLTRLAVERSPERRIELLHKVTDLYNDNIGKHSQMELYLLDDIMSKIVDKLPQPSRRSLSGDIAGSARTPRTVARKLAFDHDIEIARPVLRQSTALSEGDIVEIAEDRSQGHLAAIACRAILTEQTTDILIRRGDRGVAHALSANHGARLSDQALIRLVVRAEDDDDLQQLLVERPDLSADALARLLPMISRELAAKLAERGYEMAEGLPPELVAEAQKRFAEALRGRQRNLEQVTETTTRIKSGALTLDDMVRRMAAEERLVDMAAVIAGSAELDRSVIFKILAQGNPQPVLALLRSVDLTWSTVDLVLRARSKKFGWPHRPTPAMRSGYEGTSIDLARKVIGFLKARYGGAPGRPGRP